MKIEILRAVIKSMPAMRPYLKGRARWLAYVPESYKSYDYYLANIQGLVNGVYSNYIGGEFIDSMANLISGQLLDAYQQAIADQGFTDFFLPDYLQASLDDLILNQFEFVDSFFRDIIDARVDNTPIAPLLSRAKDWAHQWDVAYEQARQLMNMKNGGNLIWRKGATENGCSTCANLDGIVMFAKEWEQLGVHPRGYPNKKLQCEGGGPVNNCDCTLEPTEQRRTAGAYGKVEEITI
jgi:hypothetical protein